MAIVDINFKKAQVVAEELRSKGVRSIAVETDVTKKNSAKKYVLLVAQRCIKHEHRPNKRRMRGAVCYLELLLILGRYAALVTAYRRFTCIDGKLSEMH